MMQNIHELPKNLPVPVDDGARSPTGIELLVSWRVTDPGEQKELVMSTSTLKQPAIVRIWRGRTPRNRAEEYEAYNYEAGIKPLIEKALGVQTLREDRENETEFMTISYWESVEAMSKFTGGDPRTVHHLDRDKEFLIELPKEVQILRFLKGHGVCSIEGSR
jgi:heme-degrading monooxygenase HmoA